MNNLFSKKRSVKNILALKERVLNKRKTRGITVKNKIFDKVISSLKKYGLNKDDEEKIRYVLKVLVFEIFIDINAFLVGIFLGILPYVILTTFVFGMLRIIGGGAHANTRVECFILYSLVVWGTIYIAMLTTINNVLIIILAVINIMITIFYVPGDTKKIPILKKRKRLLLKIFSLLLIIILYVVSFEMKSVSSVVSNIIIISTNISMFLLTPAGYKLCRCKREYKPNTLSRIKEIVFMRIKNFKFHICALIIVVFLSIANLPIYAASWPFRIYQEEVPKCILEKENGTYTTFI